MKATERCDQLVARLYRGVTFRDAALHAGIARHLHSNAFILDAGCGLDAPIAAKHASKAGCCIGVDLVDSFDPPFGVRIARADLGKLPFPPATFDLIFSRSVLEHLPDPAETFNEFARVLKPGGNLVFVTPNKYDYASIIARMTPHAFHGLFLKKTQGEEVYDDFPTYFRCNTRRAIERALAHAGLRLKKLDYLRHYPYYLMFSVPLFYLGVFYDRIITHLRLSFLQPSIYLEIEKP